MELRVDYDFVATGVWAVCAESEQLRVFGATKDEAVKNLIPLLEQHFHGKIVSAREVSLMSLDVESDEPPDSRKALPNSLLRSLARKHKPAASWYEEENLP